MAQGTANIIDDICEVAAEDERGSVIAALSERIQADDASNWLSPA
jgi:hypothetical protein